MDPVTLALQVLDKALALWLLAVNDIPKERREEAWQKFFEFWDRISALFPKPQEKP